MSEEPTRPAQDFDVEELDAALSEHDVEASEAGSRRRRPVADWGGDDLFNHVPRRRFTRSGAGAHERRPGTPSATSHQLRRNAEPSFNAALRDPEGDDVAAATGTKAVAHPAVERPVITVYEDDQTGEAAPARYVRRRPPRTVDQRLGPRPDRIAAWAFALGLLLILIAVATADAATRIGFSG